MKILKKILLGIAVIVALALLIAAFTKKEYAVERKVTIKKPKTEVFEHVKYLRNQDKFNKWANIDPAMKKEYRGTDGTIGFVSAWDSEVDDVGKGEQKIVKIEDGRRIESDLHFIRPFEGKAEAYMTTEAAGDNETIVRWGMHSKMPYPMNLMLLFMEMDKMLGDNMQTSLNTLKVKLEKTGSVTVKNG